MTIFKWLKSKEGVTMAIIPFIIMMIGSTITVYTNEVKTVVSTGFIPAATFLMWTGAILLVIAYVRKFVWQSNDNTEEVSELKKQIENHRTLLTDHFRFASTTNQALVSFINAMSNDEIQRMTDVFILEQINIDDLEKIGIREAVIKLLRAKYHELEAKKYNATISFKN